MVARTLKQALQKFGLPENATRKELKRAYLAAARKAHPDIAGGNDKKFKQVQKDFEMAEDLFDMKEGKNPTHGRAQEQAQQDHHENQNYNGQGPWPGRGPGYGPGGPFGSGPFPGGGPGGRQQGGPWGPGGPFGPGGPWGPGGPFGPGRNPGGPGQNPFRNPYGPNFYQRRGPSPLLMFYFLLKWIEAMRMARRSHDHLRQIDPRERELWYEEERRRRILARGESPEDYYNSRVKKNLGYSMRRPGGDRPEELQVDPSSSSNQPPQHRDHLQGIPHPDGTIDYVVPPRQPTYTTTPRATRVDGRVTSWEPGQTQTGGFDNTGYTSARNARLEKQRQQQEEALRQRAEERKAEYDENIHIMPKEPEPEVLKPVWQQDAEKTGVLPRSSSP